MRRMLLSLIVLLSSLPTIGSAQQSTQQTVRQLLEVVQTLPDGLIGEWTIGDQKFLVRESTLIDSRVPVEVGSLVAILYSEGDEQGYILRMQPLPLRAPDLNDGPYVLWKDATSAEVITLFDGKVNRETHDDLKQPKTVSGLPGPVSSITLDPAPPVSPPAVWDRPSRLMAISDLEGHYQNARQFLENSGIIDPDGHWAWGDGHLVLIGDLVDRGMQVTELMWMVKRLEREAAAAGGHVHYILGNHEAMVMAGDLRYIHPKYVFTTQQIGLSYDELFSASSDIGRWWRTRNGVEVIGDLLFVHGGYSPLLDEAGLSPQELNHRIRLGLAPAIPQGATPGDNPVGHQHGPFWYRGYFDEHQAGWGKATDSQIKQILERHRANHVVIGHTLVRQVGPLDPSGLVIAIDVEWSDPERGEGLLQENGVLWRVNMNGDREKIEFGKLP